MNQTNQSRENPSKQKKDKIYNILKNVIPELSHPSASISLKSMPSFANFVYKISVYLEGQEQETKYLYKQFRQYLSEFSSKKVQNEIVQILGKSNICPKVLYIDENHRVEEFVNGSLPSVETVKKEQIYEIVSKLASMNNLLSDFLKNKCESDPIFQSKRQINQMFKVYSEVVNQCQKLHPEEYGKCETLMRQILDQKIREKLAEVVPKQLVATHNDVHFHNIIVPDDQKQVSLYIVDYQFFSLNYRGFQLGNFFNQYATDYVSFEIKQELEMDKQLQKQLIQIYYSQINKGKQEISEGQAMRQVEIGRMLSHLFWFFIGVKQIKDPNINLDMGYYVKRRYEEFMKFFAKLC